MQKPEKSRAERGKRAWRSSGSEASSDISPAPLVACPLPPSPPPPPPPASSSALLHQRGGRRRERGLRRLWTAVRSVSGGGGGGGGGVGEEPASCGGGGACVPDEEALKSAPTCSLPLLQVWPTQESPRGEADGQSFVFPLSPRSPHTPLTPHDRFCLHDSGIDSIQVSPSVGAGEASPGASPSGSRRGVAGGLLHPEHARLLRQSGLEEAEPPARLSPSSSAASSLASVHHSAGACSAARTSDPWLRDDRRRSSTLTMTRYSLFDALDLEYALLRAAARGSVGPYSLSESLHKLTFTQSLAFPALARGLAGKRARTAAAASAARAPPRRAGGPHAFDHPRAEPALNVFAKVVTTLVLVLVSVLVFGVVYKFVRT